VQLRVTVTGLIDYTFTLVFRRGAIAVLCVHGAPDQDEARAFASSVLPHVAYEVRDGDETNGRTQPFHAWTCAAAQESWPLRHASLLRSGQDYQQEGEALQPKKLSELTDTELEQMYNEVEEVIEGLSAMDPAPLTEQAKQERQQYLSAALDLGEALELEQMRRLVAKVQRRVREMKAQTALIDNDPGPEEVQP
jgi:hypothetical protein